MTKYPTIAIASGKGGTGKTTIATNLALAIAQAGNAVQYIDCDVEEPNGEIFLRPSITSTMDASVEVPYVDSEKCIFCGRCSEICQFSAIVLIKDKVLTFEQLCHSCGGCQQICPAAAIENKQLNIGKISSGQSGSVNFIAGRLNIGDIRTPKLIKETKGYIKNDCVTIIDAPPGTTCPAVEAIRNTDYCLLVTEPTPFGLNDLKLAIEMVRTMNIPFSVLLNRYGTGDNKVEQFCKAESIDIILKLHDDRRIAECYSEGKMILESLPEYKQIFSDLAKITGAV